jgi:hypothetical protein
MTIRLCERNQFPVPENGTNDADVWEVRPADVRIVDNKDVARIYVIVKCTQDRLSSKMKRADVSRKVLRALSNCVSFCITQCGGEIATVYNERMTRSEDLLGHLVNEG